jgi:ABC-type branched-subunit amino acid transport system ATPase component/ABC-type branched-subunit amino acid transport system permease subunit
MSAPGDSAELRSHRQGTRVQAAWAGAAIIGLWLVPYWHALPRSATRLTGLALLFGLTVMGLNLVFGMAGQVTLGPAAVFAVGAYGAGIVNAKLHWNPFITVAFAAIVASVVGLIIGIPALRVGGFYLAMITALAANAITAAAIVLPKLTGGSDGLIGLRDLNFNHHTLSTTAEYRVILIATAVSAALVANISRSSWGRWFRALSASEPGTSALGVSVYQAKLTAFVLSALFGGIAGGLYAHTQLIVDPRQFTFNLSLALFSALVIGGLGSLWGPLIGSFLYVLLPFYLLPSNGSPWVQVLYGGVLMGVMVLIPNGLAPTGARTVRRAARRLSCGRPGTVSARTPLPPASPEALRPLMREAQARRAGRTVLEVVGASHAFGAVKALDEVSLAVHAGQVTALIGPNGSGKTTLLNVCSGYLALDSGTVRFEGRDVTALKPHRRAALGLARTFQGAVPFRTLTPTQNVMSAYRHDRPSAVAAMLSLRSSRRYERDAATRAEAILGALAMGHLVAQQAVTRLGDVRTLDLARALALDPVALLLDEPAAGVDLAEVEVLKGAIRAIRDAGVGVLLVEHDVAFVTDIADQVTVLDQGRVIYSGPAEGSTRNQAVIDAYFGAPEVV